jgi:hypothetical protein
MPHLMFFVALVGSFLMQRYLAPLVARRYAAREKRELEAMRLKREKAHEGEKWGDDPNRQN